MEHQYKQHYAAAAVATVTKIIESKVFGSDRLFVSFTLDKWHTDPNQFCSVVLYGTMTVSDGDLSNQSHPLVFKFKHLTPEKRKLFRNDEQFHNEKLFYEQIAPFMLAFGSKSDGDCPTTPSLCRYIYGRNECGDLADQDLIVLENETVRGYRPVVDDHPLILNFDHLVVAIRALAKFHSLSFRAKHMDNVNFMKLVAKVEETQFDAEGRWYISGQVLEGILSTALDILVERKGDSGGYDQKTQQFRTEMSAEPIKMLKRSMKPNEPLSVLCHGDFGRHNLLFRYDDDGRLLDALVYDMALIRYGSLALDLVRFVYCHADRQTRDDHWDELIDVYYETLASVAGTVPIPDRGQLDAEIRKLAYYGLSLTAIGSRLMLEDQVQFDLTRLVGLTDDEALQVWLSMGGKRATEWTVDVVQHYLDMVYTDKAADTTTHKTPRGDLP